MCSSLEKIIKNRGYLWHALTQFKWENIFYMNGLRRMLAPHITISNSIMIQNVFKMEISQRNFDYRSIKVHQRCSCCQFYVFIKFCNSFARTSKAHYRQNAQNQMHFIMKCTTEWPWSPDFYSFLLIKETFWDTKS